MSREEYGEQYEKNFPKTVGYLALKGLTRHQAEEIAQEAWVRGWENIGQYRGSASLITWVNRIALHAYVDFVRRSRPKGEMPERTISPDVSEYKTDLFRILERINPIFTEALYLRFWEGCKPEEIAQELGLAEGGVKTRLRRGLQKVRVQLDGRFFV